MSGAAVVAGLEAADVEHGVDGPGGRQLELVGVAVLDGGNFEGADVLVEELGGQLGVAADEGQMPGGE